MLVLFFLKNAFHSILDLNPQRAFDSLKLLVSYNNNIYPCVLMAQSQQGVFFLGSRSV